MQIEYIAAGPSGWTELKADPSDFDAYPPLPSFRMQWPAKDISPDRAAVASALLFSPWIAGSSDHIRPLSALTAQRITEWFSGIGLWVSPGPVRIGGFPIPRGSQILSLDESPAASDYGEQSLTFSEPLSGSSETKTRITIATNLAVFLRSAPPSLRRPMRVGAAVLLSEVFDLHILSYRQFAAQQPDQFNATSRLLESVSIGLDHG